MVPLVVPLDKEYLHSESKNKAQLKSGVVSGGPLARVGCLRRIARAGEPHGLGLPSRRV